MEKISADRKDNIRNIFIGIGGTNLFFVYMLYRSWSWGAAFIFASLDICAFVFAFLTKTLSSISVDKRNDMAILEFKNLFNQIIQKETDIRNLGYTYKVEAISESIDGKTLRLFIDKKKVVKIYRGHEGWPESLLDDLVLMLERHHVNNFNG